MYKIAIACEVKENERERKGERMSSGLQRENVSWEHYIKR